MTKLMCGYEWGTDNDYKIASEYGDLEEFKAEALELCRLYTKEAGYLVDSLSNTWPARREPHYDQLTVFDKNYSECLAITARAELPQWQKKLVMKWAILQSTYPKLFSIIARIAY
jgi:hypothetical protein